MNQSFTIFKTTIMWLVKLISCNDKILVSSAYKTGFDIYSVMYKRKSKGPKTEPSRVAAGAGSGPIRVLLENSWCHFVATR